MSDPAPKSSARRSTSRPSTAASSAAEAAATQARRVRLQESTRLNIEQSLQLVESTPKSEAKGNSHAIAMESDSADEASSSKKRGGGSSGPSNKKKMKLQASSAASAAASSTSSVPLAASQQSQSHGSDPTGPLGSNPVIASSASLSGSASSASGAGAAAAGPCAPSASSQSAFAADSAPVTVFAVYNYKGGVAKTTNLINLATQMARGHEKVLIIDCDPQCNLTTFFAPQIGEVPPEDKDDDSADEESFGDAAAAAVSMTDDEVDADPLPISIDHLSFQTEALHVHAKRHEELDHIGLFVGSTNKPNLYNALRGTYEKVGNESAVLAPVQCDTVRDNLFLLRGSPLIVKFERELNNALASTTAGVTNLGSIRRLFELTAQSVGARVVLVDLGPSSGILNKIVVMGADYVIPTAFPDYYSLTSAEGWLTWILPDWMEWLEQVTSDGKKLKSRMSKKDQQAMRSFWFKKTPPKILPFIVTNYDWYTKAKAKAKQGQEPPGPCIYLTQSEWIKDFQHLLRKRVPPTVAGDSDNSDADMDEDDDEDEEKVEEPQSRIIKEAEKKMLMVQSLFVRVRDRGDPDCMVLPMLREVGVLQKISHLLHVPMPDLTQELLKKEPQGKGSNPQKWLRMIQGIRTRFGVYGTLVRLLAGSQRVKSGVSDLQQQLLAKDRLSPVAQPKDGDCVFNSLLDQMNRSDAQLPDNFDIPEDVQDFRSRFVTAIESRWSDMEPFFPQCDKQELYEFAKLRHWNGRFGDSILQTVTRLLNFNLIVYDRNGKYAFLADGNRTAASVHGMTLERILSSNPISANRPTFRIVYNGVNHYDSTEPLPAAAQP